MMSMGPVDLYEQLKPKLGEDESKALIDYMDEKVRREVATKEDLLILKSDLEKQIQDAKSDLEKQIQGVNGGVQTLRGEMKDDIWKLRVLVIVVLVLEIVLNPKIVAFIGKIFGLVK